jgi:hypothetical protein
MMDEYWAELLERYAKQIRDDKVRHIQFEQLPLIETGFHKVIRVTIDFGEVEAQVKVV